MSSGSIANASSASLNWDSCAWSCSIVLAMTRIAVWKLPRHKKETANKHTNASIFKICRPIFCYVLEAYFGSTRNIRLTGSTHWSTVQGISSSEVCMAALGSFAKVNHKLKKGNRNYITRIWYNIYLLYVGASVWGIQSMSYMCTIRFKLYLELLSDFQNVDPTHNGLTHCVRSPIIYWQSVYL